VNSLPKTVTRERRGCDLNPGPSAPESSTLPSHPGDILGHIQTCRLTLPRPTHIGAAAQCDPWNASPTSLDIARTEYFGPVQLLQLAGRCGKLTVLPQTSLLNLSGEAKRSIDR